MKQSAALAKAQALARTILAKTVAAQGQRRGGLFKKLKAQGRAGVQRFREAAMRPMSDGEALSGLHSLGGGPGERAFEMSAAQSALPLMHGEACIGQPCQEQGGEESEQGRATSRLRPRSAQRDAEKLRTSNEKRERESRASATDSTSSTREERELMYIRIDLICEIGHVLRDVQHDNTSEQYTLCTRSVPEGTCLGETEQYYGETRSGERNCVMRGKGNDGFSYDD